MFATFRIQLENCILPATKSCGQVNWGQIRWNTYFPSEPCLQYILIKSKRRPGECVKWGSKMGIWLRIWEYVYARWARREHNKNMKIKWNHFHSNSNGKPERQRHLKGADWRQWGAWQSGELRQLKTDIQFNQFCLRPQGSVWSTGHGGAGGQQGTALSENMKKTILNYV